MLLDLCGTHRWTQVNEKARALESNILGSCERTHGGPAPGAVLTHCRGWAVLTLPMVVCGEPIGTANGVLVIGTALYIQWLLGNGVLRAKGINHYTYNQKHVCEQWRKWNELEGKRQPHFSPAVCLTEPVWSHVLPQPLLVSMLAA